MKEVKQALLNYKIYFPDGNEVEDLDKYNDPDFEKKLRNGEKAVYSQDGKLLVVGKDCNIMSFYNTLMCANCFEPLHLQSGETVCNHCGERTWLPVTES